MTSKEFRAIVRQVSGRSAMFTNKCTGRFGMTNARRMGAWVGMADAFKIAAVLVEKGAREVHVTGHRSQYVRCTVELSPKEA